MADGRLCQTAGDLNAARAPITVTPAPYHVIPAPSTVIPANAGIQADPAPHSRHQ